MTQGSKYTPQTPRASVGLGTAPMLLCIRERIPEKSPHARGACSAGRLLLRFTIRLAIAARTYHCDCATSYSKIYFGNKIQAR